MEVLRTGARSLRDYPYDDTKCPMPLPPQRAGAKDFSIESYEMVWNQVDPKASLDQVKGALAKGHPVVVTAALDRQDAVVRAQLFQAQLPRRRAIQPVEIRVVQRQPAAAVFVSSSGRKALLADCPAPSAAMRCCSRGFSAIAAA